MKLKNDLIWSLLLLMALCLTQVVAGALLAAVLGTWEGVPAVAAGLDLLVLMAIFCACFARLMKLLRSGEGTA